MNVFENVSLGRKVSGNDFMRFDYEPEVSNFAKCTGYWYDRVVNVLTGESYDEGHCFNMIMNSIGRLAAARFRGGIEHGGLQMWAVGSGASSWDARWDGDAPPAAEADATGLVNEIGRLPIHAGSADSSIVFVDASGNPTDSLTNRILVRRLFGRTEANGDWREFALFGGNATEERGSGIMVNHKLHRIITKTSDMTVERNIIFTFN